MSRYFPVRNGKINNDVNNNSYNKNNLLHLNEKEVEVKDKFSKKKKSIISYLKEYSNKIITKYFVVYMLFILSISFYLKSLKGCTGSFEECQSSEYLYFYLIQGIYVLISCIIFILLLLLNHIMKLNKINYLFFVSIYFIIFSSFTGTDFAHHGTYNTIYLFYYFSV